MVNSVADWDPGNQLEDTKPDEDRNQNADADANRDQQAV